MVFKSSLKMVELIIVPTMLQRHHGERGRDPSIPLTRPVHLVVSRSNVFKSANRPIVLNILSFSSQI